MFSFTLKNLKIIKNNNIIRSYSAKNKIDKDFPAKYCLNLVQKYDHDNFLCTLLLNGHRRRYAFSLRAFNVEIAKGSTVSEDTIGRMKLRFWIDAIDKCYDKNSSFIEDHPVLKELKLTIDNNKLTKGFLKRLVTSRDRPRNQNFLTIKEMEEYAEQSVSSLYYLILEIYGVKNINVDHAISHLGKAQGIVNMLRSIPYRGRSEAISIPQEILIKHGVSQERVIRDKVDDKGVEECVFEIATTAHQHLQKARNLSNNIPKNIREIFLPSIAVERFLERLRSSKFRLSDQKILRRDQLLPLAFYWNKLRSKY